MDLSIIIPCYNEAKNLPRLLARCRDVFAGQQGIEVVFVNNGSTDETAAVLARELAKPTTAILRSVLVPVNQGYGFGILSGLRAGVGEFLAWTHADMQTDPHDVLLAFQQIKTAADPRRTFVRGRRLHRPLRDAVFTAGMSVFASCVLGVALSDVNAQPKLFHRSFLDRMSEPPHDFSLDVYALYLASKHGLHILEQPVSFLARTAGEAKGGGSLKGKVRLTRRTVGYILELRRKLRASA